MGHASRTEPISDHRAPLGRRPTTGPAGEARYDAIIIGGGIQGAMAALELARRGLRPILLERDDFGQHTSWNSLRILHGGLRYLQSLDLVRCRQSVRERHWFLTHFPDLARPQSCLMPLYGQGARRPSLFRAALALNHLMSAGLQGALPPSAVLSAGDTLARAPGLDRTGLQGGALWHDGVMPDSQRLVIETLRWAAGLGAECRNHTEVMGLLADRAGCRVEGVLARDHRTGEVMEIRSGRVVNCAGPWARGLSALLDRGRDRPALFHPSIAFNLLIDRPAPAADALAVSCPGGAALFLLPWKGRLLAGTDHAAWTGGIGPEGCPEPGDDAVLRFLDRLNRALPGLHLDTSDVQACWAGLLPASAPGSAAQSRRPVILDHAADGGPRGLITVSGVKFTTARLVAEQAVRLALSGENRKPRPWREIPRTVVPAPPTARAFARLAQTDPDGATRVVRRLLREEAIWTRDDLMLRRTDWGVCPVHSEEAGAAVDRLALSDPELQVLAHAPPDRSAGVMTGRRRLA